MKELVVVGCHVVTMRGVGHPEVEATIVDDGVENGL